MVIISKSIFVEMNESMHIVEIMVEHKFLVPGSWSSGYIVVLRCTEVVAFLYKLKKKYSTLIIMLMD